MCQRSGKYSRRVEFKYAGHVTQWLVSFNEEYSQNRRTLKCDNAQNMTSRKYMLVQLKN